MDTPNLGASAMDRRVKTVGPPRLPILLMWRGVEPMTRTAAQRIRFGILAARHALERERLTPWQVDYLEGCEASGWRVRDSRRAFDRERFNARCRAFGWRER